MVALVLAVLASAPSATELRSAGWLLAQSPAPDAPPPVDAAASLLPRPDASQRLVEIDEALAREQDGYPSVALPVTLLVTGGAVGLAGVSTLSRGSFSTGTFILTTPVLLGLAAVLAGIGMWQLWVKLDERKGFDVRISALEQERDALLAGARATDEASATNPAPVANLNRLALIDRELAELREDAPTLGGPIALTSIGGLLCGLGALGLSIRDPSGFAPLLGAIALVVGAPILAIGGILLAVRSAAQSAHAERIHALEDQRAALLARPVLAPVETPPGL